METERRQAARKRLNQLAYIRIGADNGGLISDLGEGGLGFQTIAAIEREGPLRFWFSLDAADRVQATGMLAWTDDSRKVGGLRFTQISKESLDQIKEWMGHTAAPMPVEAMTPPPRPAPRDPLRFSPPPRMAKSGAAAMPNESVAVAPPPLPTHAPRPEPLRVMATAHNWSAPVLSAPPRAVVSPEMVRGATTGLTILAVVLTVIGLVFGFHRELGQTLVRLGDRISGESPLADAAPASTPGDSTTGTTQQPVATTASPAATSIPTTPTDNGAPRVVSPQSQPPAGTAPTRQPGYGYKRAPAGSSAAGFQNLSANNAQATDDGQIELDTARQFLEAPAGSRKTVEAAKWLWLSVEKGNPAAEILLADMFAHGEGVTKNCDQARVLLAAALRHGDSEAARKLRALDDSGCR